MIFPNELQLKKLQKKRWKYQDQIEIISVNFGFKYAANSHCYHIYYTTRKQLLPNFCNSLYFGTRSLNRKKSEMAYHRKFRKIRKVHKLWWGFRCNPWIDDGRWSMVCLIFVNFTLFVPAFNPRNNSLLFRPYPSPSPSFFLTSISLLYHPWITHLGHENQGNNH